MSRYLRPAPSVFEERAVLTYLNEIEDAVNLLSGLRVTIVEASVTLDASEAGLILLANTGAINVTLPDNTNSKHVSYLFIKTTNNAHAVTLKGDINGVTDNADIDAQYDRLGVICDGSEWLFTEREIA